MTNPREERAVITREEIERLDALWEAIPAGDWRVVIDEESDCVSVLDTHGDVLADCFQPHAQGALMTDNAQLIAALHNAWPTLRASLLASVSSEPGQHYGQIVRKVREIHQTIKRGEATQDHGVLGNLDCILDHVSPPIPDPLSAAPEMVMVPEERSYAQRAKSLIAFNQCTGDLDDKLEAAHRAMIEAKDTP